MPFKVENADFIADKLAAELLPNQEVREVYKNAEEAVSRRRAAEEAPQPGRIEIDVDWPLLEETGEWFLACADNGDAMNRVQLERYTTTLAVRGAGNTQGLRANQGMGLKIAGPTRHKRGVLIRSLRDGEAWMVQVGWDGHEYGLIPIGPDGELIMQVTEEMFPAFVLEAGSGTVVTFLGNDEPDNTFAPPGRARGWLLKYLNQRFFRLGDDAVDVLVRVPAGDEEVWPRSRAEADERMRGEGGPSFNLTRVRGTATVWDEAAARDGADSHGTVELRADPTADVPEARLHWWVLPTGPGTDVSTRTASGGSLAVLFQNELHDWRIGGQANPFFARLGVLYGKTRIAFVLEPLGSTISSDFARAHVLVGGRPVFEGDAWLVWSEQFRTQVPEAIRRTMAEEQARIQAEDPDRARRIRDRLRDVMRLLRPRRFRSHANGHTRAGGPHATGPGSGDGPITSREGTTTRRRQSVHRGIGAVLTQSNPDNGEPASEVFSILQIEPKWVTEAESEGFTIVSGNGSGLKDRAAALAGEDAATAPILLINRQFRGYETILATVNEWANPDGDDAKAHLIEDWTREWVEQKLIESVTGLRQLENGSTWLATHFDDALSPTALTAAFMADRYHTLREVRRQVGSLRSGSGSPA